MPNFGRTSTLPIPIHCILTERTNCTYILWMFHCRICARTQVKAALYSQAMHEFRLCREGELASDFGVLFDVNSYNRGALCGAREVAAHMCVETASFGINQRVLSVGAIPTNAAVRDFGRRKRSHPGRTDRRGDISG
ncbi:predicted protein [Histoplasma capsulatum var. duboisii H88]|uniref:Predicted protein n=2 Tax=Ajellomyces capsulatus TaxID=5037 RepID=F0U7S4_AJEC8|nr:predicted protein [Histoplasma capsulatum H143]EGC41643.1 predicted protein [Histoplasma capsulatum var. duboisii H88]